MEQTLFTQFLLQFGKSSPLFLLIFLGFALSRWFGFNKTASTVLSRFAFNIALPAMLFRLLISLKYANGLRNGANSDTHRCKQLTEHGEERCIKLREVAGFSAVRTIFQIVGPRKILHCLLGK